MRTPSVRDLPVPLARAACRVAERLASAGFRAWIVGGAVRDLALGRTPTEVDMASPATPERVVELFPRTVPVGVSFGTVLVQVDESDVEHTTFRTEGVYRDARHPEEVAFGQSVEQDAARRDFTCNAMFLDPRTDEVRDPTGGLEDLRAGRLACVGDPAVRFAEDALRLLRLARFAGALGLAVDARHLEAARAAGERLERVAVERVLKELEQMCRRGGAPRACGLLAETDLLARVLPSRAFEHGLDARLAALAVLEGGAASPPGARAAARDPGAAPAGPGSQRTDLAELLAVLLGEAPLDAAERATAGESATTSGNTGAGPGGAGSTSAGAVARGNAASDTATAEDEVAVGDVERLRPSRELVRRFRKVEVGAREACALGSLGGELPGPGAARSRVLRLLRAEEAPSALRVARARLAAAHAATSGVEGLEALRAGLGPEVLRPAPWLRADDLAAAGVPRGPRWGELLREAEEQQLRGRLSARDEALAWLAERAQDGGNARRSE